MDEASALGCLCTDVAGFAEDAKVGLRLRAIVEAEDSFDGTDELGGKGDAAFADAVGCAFVGLVEEGDAEGLLHGGDGAGEFDGSTLRAGSVRRYGETEL